MTDVNIFGQIRGAVRQFFTSAQQQVQPVLSDSGELLVVQSLPMLAELVRMGDSWQILSAATAALTAVPTTTAGHSLYNGETPGSGKSYIVDSFGCVEIVTDATQQNSLALFAMMNKGTPAAPTDAGLSRGSLSGKQSYGGTARTIAGHTVVDDVWTPHGPAEPGAAAFAGAVWRVHEQKVKGLYIVRPGGLFNIAAAKSVATASQIRYFIRWHEVKLNLG